MQILSASYPWIARKVLTDSSPELRQTLKALLYKKGRFRVDRLESLVSESTFSSWENSALKEAPVKLDTRGKVRGREGGRERGREGEWPGSH